MAVRTKTPRLGSLRVKNFKAIRDSKKIPLSPFTVIIGDNGSGKRSLIDALEAYYMIATEGLIKGVKHYGAFHDIWNKAVPHKVRKGSLSIPNEAEPYLSNPMEFRLEANIAGRKVRSGLAISSTESNKIAIVAEEVESKSFRASRFDRAPSTPEKENICLEDPIPEKSILTTLNDPRILPLKEYIEAWQFLFLDAKAMGSIKPQVSVNGRLSLDRDGSNIAEFLYELMNKDQNAYNDLVDSMRWVLPYLKDLKPESTTSRQIYFKIKEGDFELPSWVLSTGTLRILAFLVLLRSPNPPPLIVIDEIENGLDPSTLYMLLREINSAVEDGETQVIATTHSPYLLDQLPLSPIILAERGEDGDPAFRKPSESEELRRWAEKFSTGELYTMGRMHRSQST